MLRLLSNRNELLFRYNDSVMLVTYNKADSATRVQLFDNFNRYSTSSDDYVAARSLAWKGVMLIRPPFNQPDTSTCLQEAVNRAVESGDIRLMIQSFESYGDQCHGTGKPETALFYFLKSAELRQQLGSDCFYFRNVQHYGKLGELLYAMQEYKQAIQWLRTTISMKTLNHRSHASVMNTLALTWQQLGRYDSAQYWYNRSMEAARASGDTVWEAIAAGNIGWLYFEQKEYDKALPLLWKDYHTNINKEVANSGNTLHRIALIYLHRNKTDSALLLAKKGLQIVRSVPFVNPGYLRNACMAVSAVYRRLGPTDSAFYYADWYNHLNDSLNQALARNRADVVQTRLEFEKTSNRIQILIREKKDEKKRRNLLLAGIGLLLICGWLYFRWQKQRHYIHQQQLMYQKEKAEMEMKNARQQLEEFARHNIEKNELIEQLQLQLQKQHLQINEELLHQSILTENDWLHFKEMFERAHPGFMAQLQQKAPGITSAELRYAALIKLNLGNKHIATMLGIGADAVRKTKSRLRQRLQLPSDAEPEDFIKRIA
ncbi:MAG: tetratricopeptide repeat protein [Bacteroidetes bacterium]|nr:tetratricopeptide repeat protein [Bacteroidota bacterium]